MRHAIGCLALLVLVTACGGKPDDPPPPMLIFEPGTVGPSQLGPGNYLMSLLMANRGSLLEPDCTPAFRVPEIPRSVVLAPRFSLHGTAEEGGLTYRTVAASSLVLRVRLGEPQAPITGTLLGAARDPFGPEIVVDGGQDGVPAVFRGDMVAPGFAILETENARVRFPGASPAISCRLTTAMLRAL